MPPIRLPLPDADVRLWPGWMDAGEAARLHEALRAQLPWEVHRVRLFGREVPSPRLSCWIGDADAGYRYSGQAHVPRPWPQVLAALRTRLATQPGMDFNSVLANLYRDGRDCMGLHSDDEPELGAEPVIASLSLGATRRFVLKARGGGARTVLELAAGDLLVMAGPTQRHYRHGIPRTARMVGPRINLTFRRTGLPQAQRPRA